MGRLSIQMSMPSAAGLLLKFLRLHDQVAVVGHAFEFGVQLITPSSRTAKVISSP
jgi:hypothetical protein